MNAATATATVARPAHVSTGHSGSALSLTREQRAAIFARGQRDPVWWVERVVGAKLWTRQAQILESIRDHKRTAVRSCNGSGKTHVAALAVLWWLYNHPRSIVLTTAFSGRQVRKGIWEHIRRAHGAARIPLGGTLLQNELRLDDGWFALGFSTDNPDAFRGLRAPDTLIVFDEASGIPTSLWDAADSILSSGHSRFLAIGNPIDPQSRFRQEFDNPLTAKYHINAFDTPNVIANAEIIPGLVTREWTEERAAWWGEHSAMYAACVMGEFPTQGADTLIALMWAESAQARELEAGEPNVLGVDVAFQGQDSTVIVHRRGRVARVYETYHGEDPMAIAGRVIQALDATRATVACIDAIGIGAGVVARLEELGKPVQGVNVAETAYDSEHYGNRRAELSWGLRERFREGDIAIEPDERLVAELTSLKLGPPDSRGRIMMQAKKTMAHSPDRADALMLAFAADSEPRFDVRNSFMVA